jgi:ribosomal-protein-alanine N-acetyltransferase
MQRGQVETIATSERLILRRWREADRGPFAAMNADPRVMEFMPSVLTAKESDAQMDSIDAGFARNGFGLCAVELKVGHSFIGYCGMWRPTFQAHFTPCVEIGWRLAAPYWDRGFATEAARAILPQAAELGLGEIVSFTVATNIRSRRVMQKLDMTHDPADDFNHPSLPEGHPLRHHVLYRLQPR